MILIEVVLKRRAGIRVKRKYNPELKAEAIKMVNEQGMVRGKASKGLCIPKCTIDNSVLGYRRRVLGSLLVSRPTLR